MQEITKATLGALWTLQTQRFEWDWRDFQYLAEVVRHLAAKELEAATAPAETPPSSKDTGSMEAQPNTLRTSPTTFFLVREGLTGSRRTMAMVTLVERNFTQSLGELRGFLRDGNWSLHPLTTWESPSLSGSTPFATRAEPEAGRIVGGPVAGESSLSDSTSGMAQAAHRFV